jgi:hypothetical protein
MTETLTLELKDASGRLKNMYQLKLEIAATVYAQTGCAAETARVLKIGRSTIHRWLPEIRKICAAKSAALSE